METSAAGAVVFDESILFSMKEKSPSSQPSHGTLSPSKEKEAPLEAPLPPRTTDSSGDTRNDVMSTVAALASFADEPAASVSSTSSVPSRTASMPQGNLGKKPAASGHANKSSTAGGASASRALWQQVGSKPSVTPAKQGWDGNYSTVLSVQSFPKKAVA